MKPQESSQKAALKHLLRTHDLNGVLIQDDDLQGRMGQRLPSVHHQLAHDPRSPVATDPSALKDWEHMALSEGYAAWRGHPPERHTDRCRCVLLHEDPVDETSAQLA